MRIALITGASSGIGRAAALFLARLDYAVALVARSADPLDQLANEIRSAERGSRQALAIPTDVSEFDQVESLVHRTVEAFGGVDILINCAGLAPVVPLAQLTAQQWQEIINTNLSSAFYTTRAVWPIMVRQHKSAGPSPFPTGGLIINISSMASRDPFPGLGAYGAAKAGLNLLTLVTAREGHEVGIRALCIAPAAVDTPMFHQVIGHKPVGQDVMLQPEDIAEAIADALAGPLRYCSGDTIFLHKRPT